MNCNLGISVTMSKDGETLLKKYCCDCQSLQPKRECLEYKQVSGKVNGVYKIHQTFWK